MAHTFGRLIAAGPLPIRGPRSIVPPAITSAIEGQPVVYDVGEWASYGLLTITARVFSGGIALPVEGGMAIPGPEHATVYLVVTATDDSGVTVQIVSEPVDVIPQALFPVVIDLPVVVTAAAATLATATYGSATVGAIETTRWLIGDRVVSTNAAPVLPDDAAGAVLTLEVVWENAGARTIAISLPKVIDLPPLFGLPGMLLESGDDLLLESGENLLLENEAQMAGKKISDIVINPDAEATTRAKRTFTRRRMTWMSGRGSRRYSASATILPPGRFPARAGRRLPYRLRDRPSLRFRTLGQRV